MSIFLGLFWVICSLLTLSLGLYLILVNHVLDGSIGIIFIILYIGCSYLAISNFCNKGETKLPTKQDVLDGKAIYQETQVITDNDTIKTYKIVWKQKN